MGTRADFYVGRGPEAEWLGSIAWDGHPENFDDVFAASSEDAFRECVAGILKSRSDATLPEMGWPWPWPDSNTTDYAYAFDTSTGLAYLSVHASDEQIKAMRQAGVTNPRNHNVWTTIRDYHSRETDHQRQATYTSHGACIFPDMSTRRRTAEPGSRRSGVLLFGARR